MLLSFNIGVKFRIEKMMEDGLDQVHQKEQMLWVLLSRFLAKTITIAGSIFKTKCNTQPQVKKQEKYLVVDQMKQLSEITREKLFFSLNEESENTQGYLANSFESRAHSQTELADWRGLTSANYPFL